MPHAPEVEPLQLRERGEHLRIMGIGVGDIDQLDGKDAAAAREIRIGFEELLSCSEKNHYLLAAPFALNEVRGDDRDEEGRVLERVPDPALPFAPCAIAPTSWNS